MTIYGKIKLQQTVDLLSDPFPADLERAREAGRKAAIEREREILEAVLGFTPYKPTPGVAEDLDIEAMRYGLAPLSLDRVAD